MAGRHQQQPGRILRAGLARAGSAWACGVLIMAGMMAPAASAQMVQREAALFGLRSGIQSINLSPDGSKIVYVAASKGRASIAMVRDVGGGEPRQIAISDAAPFRLQWCDWTTNARIICRLYGLVDIDGVQNVPFDRLVAVNVDGSGYTELGMKSRAGFIAPIRSDGSILSWLGDTKLLVARYHIPERVGTSQIASLLQLGYAVDLVDTATGKYTNVEFPDEKNREYIADRAGVVRIKAVRFTEPLRDEYFHRADARSGWRPFSSVLRVEGREGNDHDPIVFDETGRFVFTLKKLAGRYAIYKVALDGSNAAELIASDPAVDVTDLVRLGQKGGVIGVSWATDTRRVRYFEPEYERLAKSLGAVLGARTAVGIVSASSDGRRLLISAASDVNSGRYFLHDRDRKSLDPVIVADPWLETVPLAQMKPVTYRSGDGTMVPAYLTLPPGKADSKGLPAIVMPHGGPSARDEWGYDWLVQYYAARGFAVLQPNYRGSSGFGDDWYVNNGFKDWALAMADINAGARWMASEGIADPARLAMVGWSYGGYAALQANIVAPELYKAIVAIAPVTDLEMLIDFNGPYARRFTRELVGEGPQVAAGSPRRNADKIAAPVLMFSGDEDINVDIRHAREMHQALRQAGKRSELIEYEGLDHGLHDPATRMDMLQKSDAFLRTAMGISG